ncbi:AcrR family transcriptional regulator [Paenibacillus forsythiae]|uniref:AcrR family transcriptional regulator n=1 Tax=Paenibacillus forsythiae TaxID=365616 RepID=A0ABU3H9C7_9BACL|nr:TetR/AcrR family transcriptional regulator [Paenibacillus forsythiae]MDT3427432.1 AcrR family transcriptional regulator [Paenibacillus forsythiae]
MQQTREWILEALLALLETTPYDQIKITHITKKAGVARQTYYRNYKSKDDIIVNYLNDIFNERLLIVKKCQGMDQSELFNELLFKHLQKHRKPLLKIIKAGPYDLILQHFEKFIKYLVLLYKKEHTEIDQLNELHYKYSIKYQMAGIYTIIVDWLKNDMPLSFEELITILSEFGKSFIEQGNYVPDILFNCADQFEKL